MKILNLVMILIVASLLLIPMVSAVSYVGESRMATMKDTFRVSIGLENLPGITLTKALYFYNWISLSFIFLMGAMSSKRMTRFFAILVPILAALFVWFGWLNSPNPGATYSVIIMCVIIGVISYMKGSLKENFGTGGAGSIIVNLVFYLVILQACVGLVNATGVWESNYVTGNTDVVFAPNADLTKSIPITTNTGGWWSDVTNVFSMGGGVVLSAISMLANIAISIACFAIVINHIFPFIASSPVGGMILVIIQTCIYISYMLFIVAILGKTYPDALSF